MFSSSLLLPSPLFPPLLLLTSPHLTSPHLPSPPVAVTVIRHRSRGEKSKSFHEVRATVDRLTAVNNSKPNAAEIRRDPTLRYTRYEDAKECTFKPHIKSQKVRNIFPLYLLLRTVCDLHVLLFSSFFILSFPHSFHFSFLFWILLYFRCNFYLYSPIFCFQLI